MPDDHALRRHLAELLDGRGAHVDFDGAMAGLPAELRGGQLVLVRRLLGAWPLAGS